MKMIPRHLVYISLALWAPCPIWAQTKAESLGRSERVIADLSQDLHGSAADSLKESDTLKALRTASAKGDPNAESLLADALMLSPRDKTTLAQARTLYTDAATRGVPAAHLGLAKTLLGEEEVTPEDRQAAKAHLREASARGSAEADRLLSAVLSEEAKSGEGLADAWALLVRAGEREDATACVELANAYLRGSWKGVSVPVNEAEADRLLRVGSSKRSPEAALRLAMRLSRFGMETAPEDFDESVHELYNAFIWAHEAKPELIDEIERLHDEGQLYLRTWLRARFLYESTINPKEASDATGKVETLQVKVRRGVRMTQKIAGASGGPAITVLGFPYDAQYLWDGMVQVSEDSRLSVASDDPYWTSVAKQQKDGEMPYFVKILEGEYAGYVVDVRCDWLAGDDRLIALNEAYPEAFKGVTRIALGRWRSLYSIFGQYNDVGFRPGTSADDADQIILFDSVDQKIERFYFNSDLMAWVSAEKPDKSMTDVALPPWQAIFVLRHDEAPLYLTVDGVFSGTPASLPIDPGLNFVPNVEGRLLKELCPVALSHSTIRADEFPVYQVVGEGEKTILQAVGDEFAWWKVMGLTPNAELYINYPSAFIITGDDQMVPFLMQR